MPVAIQINPEERQALQDGRGWWEGETEAGSGYFGVGESRTGQGEDMINGSDFYCILFSLLDLTDLHGDIWK